MSLQLTDSVTSLKFINQKYASLLAKLGIITVADLLTHFPRYHSDTSQISAIGDIAVPGHFTVIGHVRGFKSFFMRNRRQMQQAKIEDETGMIDVMWFNQPFLKDTFRQDKLVFLSGNV